MSIFLEKVSSSFRCHAVEVCGGVALDGALTGWGGGDLEEAPLSNLASSLASSPGL